MKMVAIGCGVSTKTIPFFINAAEHVENLLRNLQICHFFEELRGVTFCSIVQIRTPRTLQM